jgi:hypothetical protein
MPENIMDHIDDSGTFGEGFATAAKAIAGEGFEESKALENVPDVTTLVKNHLHQNKFVGDKLKGYIKKPAEEATDEQKAEYRMSLLKELGAPADAGAYEIPRPDKLPGGIEFDEEAVKAMDAREAIAKQFFFERGWPVGMVKEGIELMNKMQLEAIEARMAKEREQFESQSKELDKLWTGDSKVANSRIAFKAIMSFGTEGMKKLLKESKINEDVGNYEKWLNLGFNPEQLQIWHNIGASTKVDASITNEGLPAASQESPTTKAARKIYTHPTSKSLKFE